ncbi:hypothetical protein [Streptodolium elevatio]|uniref:Uncharacterized protein n=1 Tax=Streptodolium elevatio TaxID=3157996 RepID=A0ABV3DUZ8_9ACTN
MTTPVYGTQHAQDAGPQIGRAHAAVSYVGIAGGVLAAIGSALAWVELSIGGESETLKGTEGDDGTFVIVAALLAAALFVGGVVARKAVVSAAAAVPALVALVFGILNVADAERLPTQKLEGEGASSAEISEGLEMFDISTSFGVYVVLVGALVAVVAGVMAFLKGRSA